MVLGFVFSFEETRHAFKKCVLAIEKNCNMIGRSSDDYYESSLGPGPDTTNLFNSIYKPSGLLNVQAACRRRPITGYVWQIR